MNMIRRDTASLKGWANVWSQEKRLRPSSESIEMLKDHMMKSTLTDLRLTREWGQQRSSTAISRVVRRLAASCPKKLPNNSTIFAAEATAITLALNYYRHMDPVQNDVVIYSVSMSCLQAIESEDSDNPLICQIMNLLWALSDKGTCVRFCWVLSHWGIEGNEIVDQLAKETHDHDIDPLTTVHFANLKPLVNSYIQQEVKMKWDVSIHGRDLYLLKPTLGPPKRFRHLTRAEEIVITWLRIGHTKATKSHILSRGPPTACQHCGQTLTIEHILLECTVLQQSRDEYYTVDSLRTLFETIPEACIIEFLRKAGFYNVIWMARYPTQLFIKSVTNWRHSQVELIPLLNTTTRIRL